MDQCESSGQSVLRNCRDVAKRVIIDVNSIVSGRNCEIFTSIIATLLTSKPFGEGGEGGVITQ